MTRFPYVWLRGEAMNDPGSKDEAKRVLLALTLARPHPDESWEREVWALLLAHRLREAGG